NVASRQEQEYISVASIAAQENIPVAYLRRIAATLIKKGYFMTKEGKTGGVKLVREPDTIHLIDVIRSFQGELELSTCMFRKKLCDNRSTCVLRCRLKSIERKLIQEFEEITIQCLLDDAGTKRRLT
ncbi:MAG: hypothetical protein A2293_15565, partial [Elusimicrobia bacterium RIFOXYB2_FULL_49_7]